MRDEAMQKALAAKSQAKTKRLSKAARIAVAAGVLGAGVYILADEARVLSTEHAVVSANVVLLRTPIDGEVASLAARPGERVAAGQSLGSVRNPRVDTQRLEDLRAQVLRLVGEEESLLKSRAALLDMQRDLMTRTDTFSRLTQTLYSERLEEAERLSAAVAARAKRLESERGRRESLKKLGLTPDAEFERAATEALASAQELAAARARIAATRVQRDGAGANVFVDMGSHGASYAQQRLDEVALRIADVDNLIGARRAELAGARARLAAENDRVALLRNFDVKALGSAMVWRVIATPGEQTSANAPLLEMVDCKAAFLIAAAPQARIAQMSVGEAVRYRLAGETNDRTGRVAAILGPHSMEGERFSAVPSRPTGPTAMVRIAPDENDRNGACEVGRSARVIFSPAPGGLRGLATKVIDVTRNAAAGVAATLRQTVAG